MEHPILEQRKFRLWLPEARKLVDEIVKLDPVEAKDLAQAAMITDFDSAGPPSRGV